MILVRERSQYDKAAPDFNRRRALPRGVPANIRGAVLRGMLPLTQPRILDLGAGAGRIGEAFVSAGDNYLGVDLSAAMLTAFKTAAPAAHLVLADGARLPFAAGAFDTILMVQVLNSTQDWRTLLAEVRRVLHPSGALIVGRTEAQDDGIDARLKQQLSVILAGMGHYPYRSAANETALDWLTATHGPGETEIVATWPTERTPRQFIERHSTGARFSGLPHDVRHAALETLKQWVEIEIGTIETISVETHRFELQIFRFHREATP